MVFWQNLRRLLRHDRFRRLVTVRALTQTADGTLQVGMASHVLFNPAQQPDAWSIAAMYAVTLLPFSVVGPFVSGLLDRWCRRTVAVVVDATRALLALVIAALVARGGGSAWLSTAMFGCLMVALALNRFTLAGLAAGLQHTIDDDEYLTASAVMPMIGPLGLLVGGGLAATVRLAVPWAPHRADAVVFCCAALLWVASCAVAASLPARALGPLAAAPRSRAADTLRALADAGRHLARRRPALLALCLVTCQRALYGATTVLAMLLFRNHFHGPGDVTGAMADIGLWMGAAGVGFAASVLLVPPLAHRLGMRTTMAVLLLASAAAQLGPGLWFERWSLVVASLLVGWFAQSLKICVDTVVQAHVDDEVKGRVFVLYDGVFNAAVVLGAVLVALALPRVDDGAARLLLAAVGAGYLVLLACFWGASRAIGRDRFDRGTELVR